MKCLRQIQLGCLNLNTYRHEHIVSADPMVYSTDYLFICYIVILLYCYIVILLYCYIVILLYCYIVILLYCYIVILLYCYIVILLYCYIVIFLVPLTPNCPQMSYLFPNVGDVET